MIKIASIALVFVAVGSASAADYCGRGTKFHYSHSDRDAKDGYEFGYTSGYQKNDQGYRFRYCIKNLSDQTPFQFEWWGPRPDTLLEYGLGYGQSKISSWHDSTTGPDSLADRKLYLYQRQRGDEPAEIKTIFARADHSRRSNVRPAQNYRESFNLSSWSEFLANPPEGGVFRRVAGATFSVPSDPSEWDSYISLSDQIPESPPIRVQAFFAVEYNIESHKITLVLGIGVVENALSTDGSFFDPFSMAYPELRMAGFEGSASSFDGNEELVDIGDAYSDGLEFSGIVQTSPLGSLEPYLLDTSVIRRVYVPVTLELKGEPILEFPVELLGLPESP